LWADPAAEQTIVSPSVVVIAAKTHYFVAADEVIVTGDMAWIRIGDDVAKACGHIDRTHLSVAGKPRLLINGSEVAAMTADGYLDFYR
jgi:hypothetical protein